MFQFLHFGKNNGVIRRQRREDIEPNEIFYDSFAKKLEEKLDISEKKIVTPLPARSMLAPFWVALVIFSVFVGRVVQLQIQHGSDFLAEASQNKYIFQKVQADRGIIYDRDFKPLVQNLSSFDLSCDKSGLPKDAAARSNILQSLGSILKVGPQTLQDQIVRGQNPVAQNLDHEALIVLEARVGEFPGCQITSRPIRSYVNDGDLSHVLGYMGKITQNEWLDQQGNYSINDYVGRSGLEQSYESVLRKNPGQVRIERDAKGNIISKTESSLPESGDNVVLWLDSGLQKKLSDSIAQRLKDLGLTSAAAVALDPNTGGVLAMVSYPGYDDNVFSNGDSAQVQSLMSDKTQPLFNRAIAGNYLTGSTIKPFEAAGALQEKIISPEKQIDCEGYLDVKNQYDPSIVYRFNDNHIHGMTDMRKAIAESANVYFYTIGGGYGSQQGLGPSRIKKYLQLFGWGESSNIDLPGESSGFIPDPAWKKQQFAGTVDQTWNDGDTYNMSIGQGFIGITPLQVAAGYAAIANGGTLYEPQMVQKIVDSDHKTVQEKPPVVVRKDFIDPQNLQVVQEGMRHCVNGAGAPLASALILNSLGIPMAAKTGTAQLRKGPDGKDLLNSWVTVYAPYDHPQIVLTIMMENVHEGTMAVLPIAKDVLGWYFNGRPGSGTVATADASAQNGTSTAPVDDAAAGVQIIKGNAADLLPLLNVPNTILTPDNQKQKQALPAP